MTGASFNIVGNAIARTFGLSTQTQMGDAIKAIEAQRQSTLSILTVANRTALLLDIHKKTDKPFKYSCDRTTRFSGRCYKFVVTNDNSRQYPVKSFSTFNKFEYSCYNF